MIFLSRWTFRFVEYSISKDCKSSFKSFHFLQLKFIVCVCVCICVCVFFFLNYLLQIDHMKCNVSFSKCMCLCILSSDIDRKYLIKIVFWFHCQIHQKRSMLFIVLKWFCLSSLPKEEPSIQYKWFVLQYYIETNKNHLWQLMCRTESSIRSIALRRRNQRNYDWINQLTSFLHPLNCPHDLLWNGCECAQWIRNWWWSFSDRWSNSWLYSVG